jgi:hypothetical protein
VEDYSININRKDSIPTSEISYSGIIQRFTQSTAKRLILRPFLTRITENQLPADALFREDSYLIELPEELDMEEGNHRQILIEGEGYHGTIIFSKTGKTVEVKRELAIQLDAEMEPDSKSALLKEINSKFDQTLTFIKSTLSTSHYE